jgi:hypothetical protein
LINHRSSVFAFLPLLRAGFPFAARERATIPSKANKHLDTRALRPGVSFFFVQRRRDTEARQGVRAAGRHETSTQSSAVSQSKPRENARIEFG